jgi:hypothetical protein
LIPYELFGVGEVVQKPSRALETRCWAAERRNEIESDLGQARVRVALGADTTKDLSAGREPVPSGIGERLP